MTCTVDRAIDYGSLLDTLVMARINFSLCRLGHYSRGMDLPVYLSCASPVALEPLRGYQRLSKITWASLSNNVAQGWLFKG